MWAGPGTLVPNRTLAGEQELFSPSGAYRLVMQGDGNLVEYDSTDRAVWASGTSGSGNVAVMQGDGNLVVYDSAGDPLWASGTNGNPGASVSLLNTGQLSVQGPFAGPIWGPGLVTAGEILAPERTVASPAGRYQLVMQGDGNLVDYSTVDSAVWPAGTPAWASATSGTGDYVVMQGDGNLVVYDSGGDPRWASGTAGHPGAYLSISDSGDLAVFDTAGDVLWEPAISVRACDDTWTGASSTSWSTADNWSSGAVPGSSDWACIPASAPNTPVQLSGSSSADGITTDAPMTVSGTISLDDPVDISTATSALSVTGTLEITSKMTISGTTTIASGVLSGSGTFTVPSGGTVSIVGSCGDELSVDGARLVNDGTVSVASSSDSACDGNVQLDSGGVFENAGQLVFADTTSIDADGAVGDQFVNDAGAVVSHPSGSGTFTINAPMTDNGALSVASGTVDLNSNPVVVSSSASWAGAGTIEVTGVMQVPSGVSLAGGGSLILSGTIELEGTGSFGSVSFGSASLTSPSLIVGSSGFAPACGFAVTAVNGSNGLSGGFGFISGGSLPQGGSWVATSSPSAAGASVSCPEFAPAAAEYGDGFASGYGGGGTVGSGSYNSVRYGVGDPVDPVSGNFSVAVTDVSIPEPGAAMAFERAYDSESSVDGVMGHGWSNSWMTYVSTDSSSGDVSVHWGDGRTDVYSPGSGGALVAAPGNFTALTESSGGFTAVTKARVTYQFDTSGALLSVSDANGNTMSVVSSSPGVVTSVTDAAGRMLSLGYTGGLLASVTDPAGNKWSFGYTSGDLSSVTDPTGGVVGYTYDSSNRLVTATDGDGNVTLTNGYDSQGRVISQTDAAGDVTSYSYDPAEGTTTKTDPNGGVRTYGYNDLGELTSDTDEMGGKTSYS